VGDANSFILRVTGDSMINAGIFNGDYLVVKETSQAHNGDIVVALVDDAATVKTFYREHNRIRLQPENDAMEPIYAENPSILGRVTALLRSL
jgi:repressor LexA